MESSTIAAILIGAIVGGTLADWNVLGSLAVVTGCYGVAAIANLFIPRLAAAHALARMSVPAMLKDFGHAFRQLYALIDARFSVAGTSLFWGAGSTMRFLLIAWTPLALGIALCRPADRGRLRWFLCRAAERSAAGEGSRERRRGT
jgi:LPLT family lysophospholipid transporter-like MFS transporter